jgi:hypothetical protein
MTEDTNDPMHFVNSFIARKKKIPLSEALRFSLSSLAEYPIHAWMASNSAIEMFKYLMHRYKNSIGDQMQIGVELVEHKIVSETTLRTLPHKLIGNNNLICDYFKENLFSRVEPFSPEQVDFQTEK